MRRADEAVLNKVDKIDQTVDKYWKKREKY
jgi:hypothetical protein